MVCVTAQPNPIVRSIVGAKANIIYFKQSKDFDLYRCQSKPNYNQRNQNIIYINCLILTVGITKSPCEYLYESLTLGTLARRENCFILSARVL